MGWVAIALAFAAVWVFAFYWEDRKHPEPLWLIGLAMLVGMIAVPVASHIEGRLLDGPFSMEGSLLSRAGMALFVAGPVEESLKFLAVALLIWFQSCFDEPMDGIVYAAAGAAGFALVENFLFMQDQPSSILARGPAATGAHIFFAGFWGGALGHAKQTKSLTKGALVVCAGLGLGYLSHGLFDLTTWSANRELSVLQARIAQAALLIMCALFVRWRIQVALAKPPGTTTAV